MPKASSVQSFKAVGRGLEKKNSRCPAFFQCPAFGHLSLRAMIPYLSLSLPSSIRADVSLNSACLEKGQGS